MEPNVNPGAYPGTMPMKLFDLDTFLELNRQLNTHVAEQVAEHDAINKKIGPEANTRIERITSIFDQQQQQLIEQKAAWLNADTAHMAFKLERMAAEEKDGFNELDEKRMSRKEKMLEDIAITQLNRLNALLDGNTKTINTEFQFLDKLINNRSQVARVFIELAKEGIAIKYEAVKRHQTIRMIEIDVHLKARQQAFDEFIAYQKQLGANKKIEFDNEIVRLGHELNQLIEKGKLHNEDRKIDLEEHKVEIQEKLDKAKLELERFRIEQDTIARIAEANRPTGGDGDSGCIIS